MGLGSIITASLKGKIIATALVGVALVGGGTAAMAATPGGQSFVKTITSSVSSATPSSHSSSNQDGHGDKVSATAQATDHSNACPGLADAQNIAKAFSLSTDSKSATIKTFCSLHDGSYKGLNHALGYGEINNLLTYAQSLAKKGNATLTDSNIDFYLATALKNCGSSPIAVCVKANEPGTQHGSSADHNTTGTTNSGNAGKGSGTSAKPTATPAPRH
ncbi:hypothetical protein [Dictyobacter formicarum]|uniref:DUF732 domain-containing protein n=1 Tax=Dictyobacter formicarum TaxID=2778368 RepID=A0ABQ3VUH7_9CHLR|nr:hypothetical protein [Dictyobacter formicarum]GHO88961.1 hypothetical protein KSZ_69670 [Dictyobacter formicarum]